MESLKDIYYRIKRERNYSQRLHTDTIVRNLISGHFPELADKNIYVWFESRPRNQQNKSFGAVLTRNDPDLCPNGYVILGRIHNDTIRDGYKDISLTGTIAHEFSHIVNGDQEDTLRNHLRRKLRTVPIIGKKLTQRIEDRANMTAIERGLGEVLYQWMSYDEQKGLKMRETPMTSKDIAKIMEKRNHKILYHDKSISRATNIPKEYSPTFSGVIHFPN